MTTLTDHVDPSDHFLCDHICVTAAPFAQSGFKVGNFPLLLTDPKSAIYRSLRLQQMARKALYVVVGYTQKEKFYFMLLLSNAIS